MLKREFKIIKDKGYVPELTISFEDQEYEMLEIFFTDEVRTYGEPQWSESHTSYELCSLSINIIYELLLKFNTLISFCAIFNPISIASFGAYCLPFNPQI